MKIGFVGLGRMGYNMVERLLKHNKQVVAYNRSPNKTKNIAKKGAIAAFTIDELIKNLSKRKIIWLMLPAGKITDNTIKTILPKLNKGDILINGANSFYKNAKKHDLWCKKHKVHFFDIGVSGGIHGKKNGYPLMIGGPKEQYKLIKPFLSALSTKNGYQHFGPAGSGHFVKSVHNIVEYTYLQGLAEGVELLSKFEHKIDPKQATLGWQDSSVVSSWLLNLTTKALNRPDFKNISTDIGSVTIKELQQTKKAVKGYAPAFDVAVKIRKDKSKKFSLGKRTISAIRQEFGGHKVTKKKK
jgi:6-phosphogluconate dehydrogenase